MRSDLLKTLREPYTLLIVCMLIAATNLGLINRIVAIQNSAGQNLVSLRDGLTILAILVGLVYLKPVLNDGLAQIAAIFVCLTPFAALVGYLLEASMYSLLRESSTMATWLLALFLGRHFQDPVRLRQMTRIVIAIGTLVSLGVIIEAASGGRIALVTSSVDALEVTRRSTPTGYVTMMLAFSCLSVFLLHDRKASLRLILWRSGVLMLIAVASLLTQSRTLLFGMAVSSTIYVALGGLARLRRARLLAPVVLTLVAVSAVPVVVSLGSRWELGTNFEEYFRARFGVLVSREAAEEYVNTSVRLEELRIIFGERFPESPLLGHGLGTHYGGRYETTLVHSIPGFFLLRYGVIGLLCWLLFVLLILRSVRRAIRDRTSLSVDGQAWSLALLNIVICAFFGNIFGVTYGVQQAMVGLGCLVAYQRMERRSRTTRRAEQAKLRDPPPRKT